MEKNKTILRVKGKIKESYGNLSKIYSTFESKFEKKLRERVLNLLRV